MPIGDWRPSPGMLWSDAIGWYYPVCVPRLISDPDSTSGVRFEMVPVPHAPPPSTKDER
jgi:hypothetical protein